MTDAREIVLLCGCFWSVERLAARQPGTLSTMAGYSGGQSRISPTYYNLDRSGHSEAVLLAYDPAYLDLGRLVREFAEKSAGDPSPPGKARYRRAILCPDEATARSARAARDALGDVPGAGFEVVVGWVWHPAEPYHQRYYDRTLGPDDEPA